VVNLKMLEYFDNSKWCARKNRLLLVRRRIEKPDVLIHVEDVFVRQTLDIFFQSYKLLDVSVLTRSTREDWIVNNDAVDCIVNVRSEDCFFDIFLCDFAEIKLKATVNTKSARVVKIVSFLASIML